MDPVRILICTPCVGESVTTTYVGSILKLQSHRFRNRDVAFSFKFLSISDVYKSRNYFAALFMEKAVFTHLLFIDSDMGFEPQLIEKMLNFDKDLTAALCPYRERDPVKFHGVARKIDDPYLAERLSLDFVSGGDIVRAAGTPEDPQYRVTNGFVRVNSIGAGIMLVRRSVFERLRELYPDLIGPEQQMPYAKMGLTQRVHQCFSPVRTPDGNFLSEDKSFCARWTSSGGEIWACVDENIAHVGPSTYEGAYIERMRAGLFQ